MRAAQEWFQAEAGPTSQGREKVCVPVSAEDALENAWHSPHQLKSLEQAAAPLKCGAGSLPSCCSY